MTSLADARAACARQAALEQRGQLLGAIWADVQGARRTAEDHALPARLLNEQFFTGQPLKTYSADLICCDDGEWRVLRDDLGRHPAATLLQAPLLAVFLPGLCRLLLGQTLLLPSVPVMWLGDAATLRVLAHDSRRYWLRDGVDTSAPPIDPAKMPSVDRARLQSVVNADPGAFIAGREPLWSASIRRVQGFG